MRTDISPRFAFDRLSPSGVTWTLFLSMAAFASATPAGVAAQTAEPPHAAVTPNRSAALLGLARAQQRSGNSSAAQDAYAHLRKNWANADSEVRATASRR